MVVSSCIYLFANVLLFNVIPLVTTKFTELKVTNSEHLSTCTIRIQMCSLSQEAIDDASANSEFHVVYNFIEINDIRIINAQCYEIGKNNIIAAYVTPDCKHYDLFFQSISNYENLNYLLERVPQGAYFILLAGYTGYSGIEDLFNDIMFSSTAEYLGMRDNYFSENPYKRILPNKDPLTSVIRGSENCRDTPNGDGMLVKGNHFTSNTSGTECQPWTSVSYILEIDSTKKSVYRDQYVMNNFLSSPSGHCRNPNADPKGPWCYPKQPASDTGDYQPALYCDLSTATYYWCQGQRDSFAAIARKGYNYQHLSSLKIKTSSGKTQQQNKLVHYFFPVEKHFCTTPLLSLDRTTIDPRHYGLDDRSESRDFNFGNSKLHVMVSEPIACSNPLIGWEFIPANEGAVHFTILRSSFGEFKSGYKEIGKTTVTIREPMISDNHEIQYKCFRDNPILNVRSGDYYGFYTNNKDSKLAPLKRLYVVERSNLRYPCSRQLISLEAATAHIIDADASFFTNNETFFYNNLRRQSIGLALKPILNHDFMYTCKCSHDADCSAFGDRNMECTLKSCRCKTDHIYNRKANRCLFVKSTTGQSAMQSSTIDDSHAGDKAVDEDSSLSTFSLTQTETNPWWVVDMGIVHTLFALKILTPAPVDGYATLWSSVASYESGAPPDGIIPNSQGASGIAHTEVIVTHGKYGWKFTSGSKTVTLNSELKDSQNVYTFNGNSNNFGDLTADEMSSAEVWTSETLVHPTLYKMKVAQWGSGNSMREFDSYNEGILGDYGRENYYREETLQDNTVLTSQCIQVQSAKRGANNVGFALLGAEISNETSLPLKHLYSVYNRDGSYTPDSEETYTLLSLSDYGIHDFGVGLSLTFSPQTGIVPEDLRKCVDVAGGPEPGREFWIDCDDPVAGRYVALYINNDKPQESIKLTDVQLYTLPGCHGDEGSMHFSDPKVDMCSSVVHGCQQLCINEDACMFRCACEPGFQLNADEKTCSEINECSSYTSPCKISCVNSPGSYTCGCPAGFNLLSSGHCQDVNECGQEGVSETCGGARCKNTMGSYECACDPGEQLVNEVCEDIDECADDNGGCSQGCMNMPGSYQCLCDDGFKLHRDKHFCQDIDECSSDRQLCPSFCQNTRGSYKCVCQTGFELSDEGKCDDIDECSVENGGCEQTCLNSAGSYKCQCEMGYSPTSSGKCLEQTDVQMQAVLALPFDYAYTNPESLQYKSLVTDVEESLQAGPCKDIQPTVVCMVENFVFFEDAEGNIQTELNFGAFSGNALTPILMSQIAGNIADYFEGKENMFKIGKNDVSIVEPLYFLSNTGDLLKVTAMCSVYINSGYCNNGQCMVVDGAPVCLCPKYFYGDRCDLTIPMESLEDEEDPMLAVIEEIKQDIEKQKAKVNKIDSEGAIIGFAIFGVIWTVQLGASIYCFSSKKR